MARHILASGMLLLATIAVAQVGMEIQSVMPGSAAAAAGVQVGDELIRLDGREVVTHDQLKSVMSAHQPGDTVPLIVERDDEMVELTLTFGERPDGSVSLGVSLSVASYGTPHGMPVDASDPEMRAVDCLPWLEETYRIETMARDLDLDLSEDYRTIRTCVQGDTRERELPLRYCDNIFKVHCGGIDLLAEIGEAQVQQCEGKLRESLGLQLDQYKGWKACAKQDVFDRYSMDGEASDGAMCKAAFLDQCGTNIDAAIRTGKASAEQKNFARCCAAEVLDPEDESACRAIDDGFARGPCHDRAVCVNRITTEWIDCVVLQ